MKKLFYLLICSFFIISSYNSYAQNYLYSAKSGEIPYLSTIRYNLNLVYSPPKDNQLSEWQELPFEWRFYGQRVTGYYISDNGYITFDKTANVSVKNNTALPDAAAPNNAIYAFWTDLKLEDGQMIWTNEVRTATFKDADSNMIHIIYWIGVSPAGTEYSSTNNISFYIALHEKGDFDIVYVAGAVPQVYKATAGAENKYGNASIMYENSPELNFPSVTSDATDDIMVSYQYSDVNLDATISKLDIPVSVKNGDPVAVKGTVRNCGFTTITAFDVNYKINNGPTRTNSFTGLNLQSSQSYDFTHTAQWLADNPGNSAIFTVWISNINEEGADEKPSNDTMQAGVFVKLGISGSKKVLVEEFTGTGCGWCVDGTVQMENIDSLYHDLTSLVAIHSFNASDAMNIDAGAEISAVYSPAFPMAMIDRTLFPGEARVPISRSNYYWQSKIVSQLNEDTPLECNLSGLVYNQTNREITVTAEVKFVDYQTPDNYRLNVFIVEDKVTGDSAGYSQANFYSGNTSYPTHPYYSMPAMVNDFKHRHVLRAVLGDTWGTPLPTNLQKDETYQKEYKYILPANFDRHEIHIVTFVTYWNSDYTLRNVLNTAKIDLDSATVGIERMNQETLSIGDIFPNPLGDLSFIDLELPTASKVTTEVYDMLGRKINTVRDSYLSAGHHQFALTKVDYNDGMYFLNIKVGSKVITKRFVVVK